MWPCWAGAFFLGLVLLSHTCCAIWASLGGTANDKVDGFEKTITYVCEGASMACLLASNLIMIVPPAGANATSIDPVVELEVLSTRLQLAVISASMLMAAVFVPLGVTLYNSFVVPFFRSVWKADGNLRETLAQICTTCILVPFEVRHSMESHAEAARVPRLYARLHMDVACSSLVRDCLL